jgi:hypothetical protein
MHASAPVGPTPKVMSPRPPLAHDFVKIPIKIASALPASTYATIFGSNGFADAGACAGGMCGGGVPANCGGGFGGGPGGP